MDTCYDPGVRSAGRIARPSAIVPCRVSTLATVQPLMARPATSRQCSRTGCSERASATMAYDYARSLVWIGELTRERDPHDYDLCARHAARVSVPSGWHLDDRRPPVPLRTAS